MSDVNLVLLNKIRRLECRVCDLIAKVNTGGTSAVPYNGVVEGYSLLPDYNLHEEEVWLVLNSEGTKWLPGSIGGTFYSKGYYYGSSTGWMFVGEVPHQATNAESINNTITDKFISPATLDYWKTQQVFTVDWTQIDNKPVTFPPSTHTHIIGDITGLQSDLDNKSDVGHSHTEVQSIGINILGGNEEVLTGVKGISRIKNGGSILAYRVDSFEKDTGAPIVGSISIGIKKNGGLIGTVTMTSNNTVYDPMLVGWTTVVSQDDKIQYEVLSNTGIKNLVLTLYYTIIIT